MHFIYLHGFLSGANSYKGSFLRQKFAERGITLHTPDLNDGDFEHLTLSGQLDVIRTLAASLEGDITMLGSSMGGYLCVLFAEENPRVKQMVPIAPAFQFVTRYLAGMDPDILQRWEKESFIEVYHYASRQNRRLHYGILEDAKQYDRIVLKRQLPALVIHGIRDDTVDYQLSVEYLNSHPAAQLILLNSDHQLIKDVETIWKYIQSFLDI
jgi:pimeloyl-ACP methyl ester carboxylesterase